MKSLFNFILNLFKPKPLCITPFAEPLRWPFPVDKEWPERQPEFKKHLKKSLKEKPPVQVDKPKRKLAPKKKVATKTRQG